MKKTRKIEKSWKFFFSMIIILCSNFSLSFLLVVVFFCVFARKFFQFLLNNHFYFLLLFHYFKVKGYLFGKKVQKKKLIVGKRYIRILMCKTKWNFYKKGFLFFFFFPIFLLNF